MRKTLMVLMLALTMSGCYTVSSIDEPTPVYTYGYGYYWGTWYGPYYPYWYMHPYPRYYIPPHRIHVPSYYEKHPEYRTRDFGTKRTPPPPPRQGEHKNPPPQNNRQGNRR